MRPAPSRPRRARGGPTRILVAAAALCTLLAACGGDDAARYDEVADQLRTQARQIADDAADAASQRPGSTAATTVAELKSRVPGPPTGHLVSASVPTGTNRAEVGFALDGRVDNYGPGQITATLRLCVLVVLTPPPDPTSSITDLDCSALAPAADSVVELTG